jgi:transcriptional regulator with XRE-family HTH domain
MAATQDEPPAVARQRVRRVLRGARQATPMSQGDVARKLGWSLSKMQRIEGGEVGVSPTDLRALLNVYGITDVDEVARLTQDARVSRRQRWLTSREHREFLTPALRQLLQFEAEAVAIKTYQPVMIPGVLQTPAVAEAVLNWRETGISDDERRVRFDVRMRRRKRLFQADDAGPDYRAILDESVIKRHIGGPKVMAEQLETLSEIAQRPNVRIRVVPFQKGALIGLVVPFQLLSLSADDDDDAAVYQESYERDQISSDPVAARRSRKFFDDLWDLCLTEDATLRALAAEAAVLRSSLDDDFRH